MPLAFGTILGGMTTLIGTPPNLIVSSFRANGDAGGFGMFDFTPVGLAVALAGIAFVALAWRLVPARKRQGSADFDTGAYQTEARVLEKGKADGMTLREIEAELDEIDAQVLGLVRNEMRLNAPQAWHRVRAGDILVIEADVDALGKVLSGLGLKLEESVKPEAKTDASDQAKPKRAENSDEQTAKDDEQVAPPTDIMLMELAVLPSSSITGRSATDMRLRLRYGLNLLALSREGARSTGRLRSMVIRAGDLLLMQGPSEALAEFAADSGCVPLAERQLLIPNKRKIITASAIMALAVGVAAFGWLPTAISFALGVLASMALRTVPLRDAYQAIDWPVIVLLGALIPVAGAMETTGSADLIARFLLDNVAQGNAVIGIGLILVVTMCLSDLMNNAATAAVMCPIAIGTASALEVNADSFLMAVAIGASCSFLTPIGHQNNTLILGPGGFRFGDYWKLGLPLEVLVALVAIPMLLIVWPL
jgi:di/tricarboxylate transporter